MPRILRVFVRLLTAVFFLPALVHAAVGYTPGSFTVGDSGAANYSIPIAVPPGASGMQPSLALTYNSQGGNGLLGMGWSLSGLSAITRCPQTYATDHNAGGVNFNYADRFCLDGQRLILISGTYGYANSEYRTERDTLTKIVAYGATGNGPSYFIAQTKSGQTIQYGASTDSRIIATGKTTALVWNANRITDTVGNYLTITYTQNTSTGEYYPQRIDYAGNSTQGTSPSSSVQFVYATRSDTFTGYVAGSTITNTQRMTNIQVFEGATNIRDYRLTYDPNQAATMTQRSRLTALTECDSNLGAANCLPTTTLTWTDSVHAFSSPTRWLANNVTPPGQSFNANYQFVDDFNGDGQADYMWYYNGWYIALSNGNGFNAPTLWLATSSLPAGVGQSYNAGYQYVADFNGDGKADYMWNYNGWNVALGTSPFPDQLLTLTNGLGATTTITYKPLTNSAGTVYTKGTGAAFPQQDFQGPLYVVSQYTTSDGVGGSYPVSYSYQGARVNLQGRGFTGFSQIAATDSRTGIVTTTTYYDTTLDKDPTTGYARWPLFGFATNVTKTYGTSTISSQINTLNYYRYGTANAYYYFPYVSRTVATNYELPTSGSSYVVSTSTTNNTYHSSCATNDAYCDLATLTVTTTAGSNTFTKTTNNTYDYSGIASWVLGRLSNAQVTSTLPNGSSLTRESSFTYYTGSGLLWTEVVEPNGNVGTVVNMKQTTTYSYDGFGNKIGASVSGADGVSRPASAANNASTTGAPYAYTAGRFETSLTNAASQGESRVYDARFGTVAKLTGPNGLSTNWQYDNFGRKSTETRADGTTTTWTYSLCGTCPTNAKYYVTQTTSGAPTVTVYYDLLDRELRTQTVGYNGALIYKDTIYNNLGQVAKVSRPYYSSEVPYWTYFGYDALGRATSQSLPTQATSAGILLGKTDYAGLSTVITQYRDGTALTTTQVKDALGELVSVTDANNNITRYEYDPFGNLTKVTDPALNVTSMTYDIRGRKLTMTDPDMGYWQYSYNSVGELIKQIDAMNQTTTMDYDSLGRLWHRWEPESLTPILYTYDNTTLSGPAAKGKLSQISWPGNNTRTFVYDTLGRPITETTNLNGNALTMKTAYDNYSRVSTITYPSNYAVNNNYDANGYLMSVTDAVVGYAWWSAPAYSADGQYTAYNLGNGLTTVNQYDAATGLIQGISTGVGTGSATQYLTYQYDTLGNLKQRVDGNQANLTENFGYDNLNRMNTASVGTSINKTVAYDAIGNITAKSDVGTYTYDPLHIHAVKTAGSGSYTYDANGNQKTGPNGRVITYNSFNQPTSIIQNSKTYSFTYDPDHLRTVETGPEGITFFMHPRMDTGARFEWVRLNSGVIELKHFIYAGKEAIALYTTRSNNFNDLRYFHKDHLGSIDTITDETGKVAKDASGNLQRFSYDAWGKRRNGNWTDATTAITSLTHHGFTGHEHLDDVGLINMNGRIYDPTIARFLSADPTVQSPGNPQTLNRYTYAGNNPLTNVDPSGYGWNPFKAIVNIFKVVVAIVAIVAAVYILGPYAALQMGFVHGTIGFAIASGMVGGFAAGFAATYMATGDPRAALYGGMTGAIMGGIGGYTSTWGNGIGGTTSKVIAKSMGGGVSSVLQGGKFDYGFKMTAFNESMSMVYQRLGSMTDELGQKAANGAPMAVDKFGNLRTDGTTSVVDRFGNIITKGSASLFGKLGITMSPQADPDSHWYKSIPFAAEAINAVSKVHDGLNAINYNFDKGAYITRGAGFDTAFDTYNFAGMLPAAAFTAVAAPVQVQGGGVTLALELEYHRRD